MNGKMKLEEMINKVHCWDCLELMKQIDDKSIDMILCDLPYGTTACSWDVVIPFEPLREAYKRIIKDNWAIVLFGSQPFTTDLINSNRKRFRYELIREKTQWQNVLNCNNMPLKKHENISVFYEWLPKYNPQMVKWKIHQRNWIPSKWGIYWEWSNPEQTKSDLYYPMSVLFFDSDKWEHPTQKPVELCKRLISTYTDKWELILDNTCWSGTTCVASKELGRNFIGIEKEQKYVDIANKRLANTTISLF